MVTTVKSKTTLKDLKVGKSGKVISVEGEGAMRKRLLDMGITPGTIITIHKAAPMGDPIELKLRGYSLSIRLDDAGYIQVSEVE